MNQKIYKFLLYSVYTLGGLYLGFKLIGVVIFSSLYLAQKTVFFKVAGIAGLIALVIGASFFAALTKVVEGGGSIDSLEPLKGKRTKLFWWASGGLFLIYISVCLWIWWVHA